jgi:hypothetical protein
MSLQNHHALPGVVRHVARFLHAGSNIFMFSSHRSKIHWLSIITPRTWYAAERIELFGNDVHGSLLAQGLGR